MRKALFLGLFLIVSALIYSNENVLIERSSFILNLSVDENGFWEWTVPQSPYVFNENYIQFYPGETLFIEAEVVDDIIVNLTVVKEIIDENKTIVVEFNQINTRDNSRIHDYMMLKIINPFNKNLEYKADVYLIKYDRWWVNTSTIPVRAGLASYESWPDIIGVIVLYDFVLK
jgi:hypothetical protein